MFSSDTLTIKPMHFLYHFTKTDVLLEHILENGKLRFSPYFRTNNPKETLPWSFTLSSSYLHGKIEESIKKNFFKVSQDYIQHKIRNDAKIVCFSKDNFDKDYNKDARGYNHPRMWSQYAENHSGVCLIINKALFDKSVYKNFSKHKVFEGNVIYDYTIFNTRVGDALDISIDQYKTLEIDELIDRKIKEYQDIYFFNKHYDWSNEQEYRYVIIDETREYLYLSIIEALEGIIFGVNVSEKVKNEIIKKGKKLKQDLQFGEYIYLNSITTAVEIEDVV